MDKRLLDILCCPVTHQPLRLLTRGELDALNQRVGHGTAMQADGSAWKEPIASALMTRDGSRIYRIEDDIPVMLADMAIPASAITDSK